MKRDRWYKWRRLSWYWHSKSSQWCVKVDRNYSLDVHAGPLMLIIHKHKPRQAS